MTRVSVIIPSYNSAATIEKTLKALEAQTAYDKIEEILISDSSSDEKTQTLLRRAAGPKVKLLICGIQIMPAAARNFAALQAKGNLLCFVDSDAYPEKNWLEVILNAYESGKKAGAGAILLPEFQESSRIAQAQYFLQFNEYTAYQPAETIPFAPSCNMFCEAGLFSKAGGFPEVRASEDVLFGLKLNKLEKFWFVPDARVYHIFRDQTGPFIRNQRLLGRYVYHYRKQLRPDCWYLNKFAALLLAPAFAGIKLFKMTRRILRTPLKTNFAASFPAVIAGLSGWCFGLMEGVLEHEN